MMVVSGNDPLESFLSSVQVVKNAFTPLESNFWKVAKNFEHCLNGISKNVNLNSTVSDTNVEVVAAHLNVKKNKSGQSVVVNGDDGKKGKVPIKIFVGIFSSKCGSNVNICDIIRDGVEKLDVDVSKKGLKERCGSDNGGKENSSCLHFEVALPFLINGLLQAIPSPLKSEKKRVQKMSNEDEFNCDDSHVKLELKQRVGESEQELKVKEGKDLALEYLDFVFDQLSPLLKFHIGFQDHQSKNTNDHFKVLTSILEGKRADVNGFLGNLKFARVGGVPSSVVDMPSVKDVEEDEGVSNAVTQEENDGGNSAQKLANGLLSIPLSNVERLRSTLSTVSFTELIELLPQIGKSTKEDHPDKKKLFSVQDFFRYTESEGVFFISSLFYLTKNA